MIPTDECSPRVAALCEEAARRLSAAGPLGEVRDVQSRLDEPLRVAVAGRVKSGKSTLVNALLRHDVAPTAFGECTKAVTWFRFGYPPQARLMFAHGASRDLPLEPGQRLPATLGVDPTELDHVEVQLSSSALEALTVIDTPGLSSSHDEFSAATRRALALGLGIRAHEDEDDEDLSRRTETAASQADAMVFVLSGAIPKQDEVDALEAFRSHLGAMRASAVNTVAVLNQADLLDDDDDGDPLDRAGAVARGYEQRLGALTAAVIPTIGLLAETVEAGLLTEDDAAALRKLASADTAARARLLDNVNWFVEAPADVEPSVRRCLLERLGLYGVKRCIEWIDAGGRSTPELRAALVEISGISGLRSLLTDLFARRADVLKAANALARLERLAGEDPELSADERSWLGGEVERTRLHPTMQSLATTWAFARASAQSVELPDELADDLRRVALGASLEEKLGLERGTDRGELRAKALEAGATWRAFLNAATRGEQRRIASVVCQQYSALWHLAEDLPRGVEVPS